MNKEERLERYTDLLNRIEKIETEFEEFKKLFEDIPYSPYEDDGDWYTVRMPEMLYMRTTSVCLPVELLLSHLRFTVKGVKQLFEKD